MEKSSHMTFMHNKFALILCNTDCYSEREKYEQTFLLGVCGCALLLKDVNGKAF